MSTFALSNPFELTASIQLDRKPSPAVDRDSGVQAFERLASGEREAVGELYDLYADELFGFSLWLTGNRTDAADVVQEVFVRLLARVGRLRGVRRPRAYLLRVARSVSIDRHRRSRRHQPAEALDERLLIAEIEDPVCRLDAQRLGRWLRRLPAKQRGALYLRFFSELTYAEIGKVMGIPAFTAASRCRLGTGRLRSWLTAGRAE